MRLSIWMTSTSSTRRQMSFPANPELSAELSALREKLRAYIEDELIPFEKREGLGYEDKFSKEMVRGIWRRSRELGFYGLQLPPELGGKGLSVSELCVLKDDVAASGAILFPHVLGDWGGPSRIGNLGKYATPYQLENYILPCVRGEKGSCFAMTEPASGSDVACFKTRAVLVGVVFV